MDAEPRDGRSRLGAAIALCCFALGLLLLLAAGPSAAQADRTVGTTTVDGVITPVTADHLRDTLSKAGAAGYEVLVIRLDTPGGLMESTRQIVKGLLDAPLPVVVHVAPAGADAGSAGTFITYAAHVAAMAPATTIGAATPVDLEGAEVGDKIVENSVAFAEAIAEERDRDVEFVVAAVRDGRSITSSTALEVGAIDLLVTDLGDLLTELDGRQVTVRGETVTLVTAGAAVVEMEMTGVRQLLQLLANPNVAFLLLSLGTLAILYEIASPGLGLGGVVGAISLVLALFALSVLPVNWAGAALLVVAMVMFVAELFAPGVGVGAAGGTAALILGGLFLFQADTGVGVDWWVLAPTGMVGFAAAVLAGVLVARLRGRRSTAGADDLIGRTFRVERSESGRPRVRVGETWWRIRAEDPAEPLQDGHEVSVVDRDNLDLIVVPAPDAPTRGENDGQQRAPG